MKKNDPQYMIRSVVDVCADCDVCRYLMDTSCLFFPELYRLYDKEMETRENAGPNELRHLVGLCNFCALCPCPNIRADIMQAKTEYIDQEGLKFGIRTLEDVERVGKLCGRHPRITNTLFRSRLCAGTLKRAMGIHESRKFPEFPKDDFSVWVRKHKLDVQVKESPRRKIAYFAGCTARYLFPEVARAVLSVFQKNGIDVYYPEQKCCGMPTMLEGDRKLTLEFVQYNIDRFSELVEDGYSIVCSCSTCGYMLKTVLKEGAYYSAEYQASVGADKNSIKIPTDKGMVNPGSKKFVSLQKKIYGNVLKDEGYFSAISPRKRIRVAENTFDLGEYLSGLHGCGELDTRFGTVPARIAYYPPCHLREQEIGRPYMDLMAMIPGIAIEPVDWSHYCCGMAGIMGFKQEFHESSLKIGERLVEKITALNPDRLVTDCLSCRIQFNQSTPYDVRHPVEILKEAYDRN
jgi:glycerol-3-phosphate dehydrogenase subunit C